MRLSTNWKSLVVGIGTFVLCYVLWVLIIGVLMAKSSFLSSNAYSVTLVGAALISFLTGLAMGLVTPPSGSVPLKEMTFFIVIVALVLKRGVATDAPMRQAGLIFALLIPLMLGSVFSAYIQQRWSRNVGA